MEVIDCLRREFENPDGETDVALTAEQIYFLLRDAVEPRPTQAATKPRSDKRSGQQYVTPTSRLPRTFTSSGVISFTPVPPHLRDEIGIFRELSTGPPKCADRARGSLPLSRNAMHM